MPESLRKVLKKHNIDAVWHFTPRENWETIEKQGLWCTASLIAAGQEPKYLSSEGSRTADSRTGLDRFVHLCFVRDSPMLFVAVKEQRVVAPIWVKIDVEVLFDPSVQFTSGYAHANDAVRLSHAEAAEAIDFGLLASRDPFDDYREARKAEILIPTTVAASYILGVEDY